MRYRKLTEREEEIGKIIVDCAYKVHSTLGPGLLESIYETCFCYELKNNGLSFNRQTPGPIVYEDIQFEKGLRLDVLVEDIVICEIKAVEVMVTVFEAQLLSYLKLTKKTRCLN